MYERLEQEIENVLQMCEITNPNQIKDKIQLKSLRKSVDFMTNKSGKYERERQEMDNVIDGMKKDFFIYLFFLLSWQIYSIKINTVYKKK